MYISNNKTLWFTADTHLGHANIIKYCNRPFSNIDEMNRELCKRWNNVVKEDDFIFIVGDFCFGGKKQWREYLSRLNGYKFLVKGNHDKENNIPTPLPTDNFDWCDGFVNIKVSDDEFDTGEQYVTVCHYPMLSWYRSYHGAWQLFGHVHGTIKGGVNQLDVGVDVHNFTPVNWESVKEIITKKNLDQNTFNNG